MTDQPMYDARAEAFAKSRQLLAAAEANRADYLAAVVSGRVPDAVQGEYPDTYWGLVDEAAILATLANADASVGIMAGGIAGRDAAAGRRTSRAAALDFAAQRAVARRTRIERGGRGSNDVAPWQNGMRVTLTEGDYAGRSGRIHQLSVDPPAVMSVELEPPGRPDDPSEPITLVVPFSAVELAEVQ